MRLGLTNLGLNALRKGSGGAAFSPSSLFSSGQLGMWIDPSDITTGFQDSAGTTPQTATGQSTGKRSDKSGRGNHLLQATAGFRPIYTVASTISSDVFDGVDDALGASFAAASLSSNTDAFIAIKRTSAGVKGITAAQAANAALEYFGVFDGASGASADGGASGSAWSYFVDGVAVGTTNSCTRTQLDTALSGTTWHILEVRNLDLSTWTGFGLDNYTAGFSPALSYGGHILCPAQSSGVRSQIRTWLGAKVGLSL